MARYSTVATGGTFDLLHRGHLELLRAAFGASSFVIIGLTSDGFAAERGKITYNNYIRRLQNLSALIGENFADPAFRMVQLDDEFGPAATDGRVQALVASEETCRRGRALNCERSRRNLPPVEVIAVPLVEARDGGRLSSTRLKNSEVDFDGNPF